jgi:Protein of unknown function (DUF2752)
MAGYVWFFWNYYQMTSSDSGISVCLFKNITGLPCPSCGTTRALIYIMKGQFFDAFNINPLGFIIAFLLIVIPIWVIADVISRRNSFHSFYLKSELFLHKKWVALPAIILILFIWILNIKRHI